MALIENKIVDRIDIVGEFKHINVIEDTQIIDEDTIELTDPEEEGGKVTIKSGEITFEGKKIKVFNPCSMGWCWQEIEEEEK